MFSDYVVYADESGDHGLANIDSQYPVFVLAFCIFEKAAYRDDVVPRFLDLKFSTFGHESVVLHSHEIRKQSGEFSILTDVATRMRFTAGLNNVLQGAPFTVIASVIDKITYKRCYAQPASPYELALRFCMERTFEFLADRDQVADRKHITVERRGRTEDRDLAEVFRQVARGANRSDAIMPFDLIFADKKANATGLQVADLAAHPTGRHSINPAQPNRAWEIIEPKLWRSSRGRIEGYGIERFP